MLVIYEEKLSFDNDALWTGSIGEVLYCYIPPEERGVTPGGRWTVAKMRGWPSGCFESAQALLRSAHFS